jgi:peptide-methionine (R)-S-oxide reductase
MFNLKDYLYILTKQVFFMTKLANLSKTEADWKIRLSAEQFRTLREKQTEAPFSGTLLHNKETGIYSCAGCGTELFSSDAKFECQDGWPSFFSPISKERIIEEIDFSHGMVRKEIMCANCKGHLGHVFDDGPMPTGMRYCVNSISLCFKKK